MLGCPSCGSGNPAGARFCNTCGAGLVAARASVRKVVTVLFCDLVGSTTLGDGADPEVLRGHMARYHDTLRTILERHGGTVEKFIGDAAMAVFGLPASHEDDALRAARSAVEIRRAVEELGFSVRIGINTGEVVAGEGETLVTGDAVNVAARLEQAAAGGEILIGALTERLVRGATRVAPIEALTVRGKAQPVAAFRLLATVDAGDGLEAGRLTPFVGRTSELGRLESALALAREQRQPQLATIVGPPGMGKSRLVRELVARSGAQVLLGRCLSYGQGITYWPLQEIAQQVGDVAAALRNNRDGELAATRLAAALGQGAATADEIAWGFRKLFESLAVEEPLIVVIDDIHWAEPTLLDLLEYLADFSADARLLLLCTARPELLESRPGWTAPRPNATLLTLEPLADSQVKALVDELGHLSDVDRGAIIDAAEGNPLFVEQLVAMRAEAPATEERLEIPPTIQALLAARIDRLESADRAVVERASVEGRLFHRGSVQHLVPEHVRPDVGRRLLTLVRRQFIRPDRAELLGEDGFRFDHVLIRDAAYNSLPKALRAELHETFADWLADRLGNDTPAEILGYHLEQAYHYRAELGTTDEALGERAADRLLAAALGAAQRSDTHAEVNLLERALALLPLGAGSRARALLELGVARHRAGEGARAVELMRQAEAVAQSAADGAVYWLARLHRRQFEIDLDPEGAADAYLREGEAALAAQPNDDEVAALAWRMRAIGHGWGGHLGEQFRAAQVAWEHARRVSDTRLETDVYFAAGVPIAFGPIPVPEGFQWVAHVVERARNRPAAEGWARHMLVHLHARLGDFERARAGIEAWRRHMRELGNMREYYVSAYCAWDVCQLSEDWVAGEHALRQAFEELHSRGDRAMTPFLAAGLAEALIGQGKLDEAEHFARISREQAPSEEPESQAAWRRVTARILAERGGLDEALGLAREAVRILAGTDLLDERAGAALELASILAAMGEGREARDALHEGKALFEQKGNLVGIARAERRLALARDGRAGEAVQAEGGAQAGT